MTQARYIMVGGFLGAGKTTAILRLAEMLRDEGQRVGLITNDQSVNLVDTAMLAAHGFPVEEITGGCFCCRFDSLTDAADKLSEVEQPDVFLAEPVGSCTDLTATVSYPLRRLYGDAFSIAPYSVLVDPVRAERILGLAVGNAFSPKVAYIYKKQLEEADLIVVNKIDTLSPERLDVLTAKLREDYPDAEVLSASARDDRNLDPWLERLLADEQVGRESIEIDYDTYAEGEALLGWFNVTMRWEGEEEFDGNQVLESVADSLTDHFDWEGIEEIAHLKMTLTPDQGGDLAVVNYVGSYGLDELEFSHRLHEPLRSGECVLNLRLECDPAVYGPKLREWLIDDLNLEGLTATIEHLEAFRPGRPVPTHRDLTGATS